MKRKKETYRIFEINRILNITKNNAIHLNNKEKNIWPENEKEKFKEKKKLDY